MFSEILQTIKAYDRIIIHRHTNPDGDAIGSQVGLKHLIKENFPEKEVYMTGDSAKRFSFMEDSEMDTLPDDLFPGSLCFILDCGAAHMVFDDRYKLAAKTIRMDHHIYCETFTDLELVDSTYESCCGLLASFAMETGLRLNRLSASSLFTGMVTDSGRFRYDATNSRTFRLASFLTEQEFDADAIYRSLYADSFEKLQLKAKFIQKINLLPSHVAYIYTTKEELQELHIEPFAASRGMVALMADIREIDNWANFTEADDGIWCELRSSKYNINPVAVKYGGGGHAKASGCTLQTREQVESLLADLQKVTEGTFHAE